MFIYQGDWEGPRESVADAWASFKKSGSLFPSQFCCSGVNISNSTASWECTSLKYHWKCIIKQKHIEHNVIWASLYITKQVDLGAKCKTWLYLDYTNMLDQCNTLRIRREILSFSCVVFCLVIPLIFLLWAEYKVTQNKGLSLQTIDIHGSGITSGMTGVLWDQSLSKCGILFYLWLNFFFCMPVKSYHCRCFSRTKKAFSIF